MISIGDKLPNIKSQRGRGSRMFVGKRFLCNDLVEESAKR